MKGGALTLIGHCLATSYDSAKPYMGIEVPSQLSYFSFISSSSMASPAAEESSGRDTPKYKKVLSKIPKITSTLKQVPGAKAQLSELYKKNRWIPMEADATETELVNIALERIQLKSSQFELFVGMLKEITGMDLIVETLELTGESLTYIYIYIIHLITHIWQGSFGSRCL